MGNDDNDDADDYYLHAQDQLCSYTRFAEADMVSPSTRKAGLNHSTVLYLLGTLINTAYTQSYHLQLVS